MESIPHDYKTTRSEKHLTHFTTKCLSNEHPTIFKLALYMFHSFVNGTVIKTLDLYSAHYDALSISIGRTPNN